MLWSARLEKTTNEKGLSGFPRYDASLLQRHKCRIGDRLRILKARVD
jgi:hypothetical protein